MAPTNPHWMRQREPSPLLPDDLRLNLTDYSHDWAQHHPTSLTEPPLSPPDLSWMNVKEPPSPLFDDRHLGQVKSSVMPSDRQRMRRAKSPRASRRASLSEPPAVPLDFLCRNLRELPPASHDGHHFDQVTPMERYERQRVLRTEDMSPHRQKPRRKIRAPSPSQNAVVSHDVPKLNAFDVRRQVSPREAAPPSTNADWARSVAQRSDIQLFHVSSVSSREAAPQPTNADWARSVAQRSDPHLLHVSGGSPREATPPPSNADWARSVAQRSDSHLLHVSGGAGLLDAINGTYMLMKTEYHGRPCWALSSGHDAYIFHTGVGRWLISKAIHDGAPCYAYIDAPSNSSDPATCPGHWKIHHGGQWVADPNLLCTRGATRSYYSHLLDQLRARCAVDFEQMGLHSDVKLRQLWRKCDRNGDSMVSVREFDQLVANLTKSGTWPEWVRSRTALDAAYMETMPEWSPSAKRDSYVNKDEFHALVLNVFWFCRMHEAFSEVVTNEDDLIDCHEFVDGLSKLGLHLDTRQAQDLFIEIDVKHHGSISFAAFCSFVRLKLHPGHRSHFDAESLSGAGISKSIRDNHGDSATHAHFVVKKCLAKFDNLEKKIKDAIADPRMMSKLWTRIDVRSEGGVSISAFNSFVVSAYPLLNHVPALQHACKHTIRAENSGATVRKIDFALLLANTFYFNKLYWIFDCAGENSMPVLDFKEFKWCLSLCGVNMCEAKAWAAFLKLDGGSHGAVRFDEFCAYFTTLQCPEGLSTPVGPSIRSNRKHPAHKARRQNVSHLPKQVDTSRADSSKWHFGKTEFGGSYTVDKNKKPTMQSMTGPIADGMEMLRRNPTKYEGMIYQADMEHWPKHMQEYTLVSRSSRFHISPGEGFKWVHAKYQALEPASLHRPDRYTDHMTYQGKRLGRPVQPGRGQGIADVPNLKIMDKADPSDVSQGSVGDCWLLSAISALAEFEGAVKQLFKHTPHIHALPSDRPSEYTITLWDLPTGKPVDVIVDERLCTKAAGGLLGCAPSLGGELWVCYLEKAVAAHCGGWDKIDGGSCTHAWRLLTGCKEQYSFMMAHGSNCFGCFGTKNPNTGAWEKLCNSPSDGSQNIWPMCWPEVGGGGDLHKRVSKKEMFERMCAWDDHNYIMGCGTRSGSDKEDTDGIVDGHCYTILDCVNNAGGTKYDLIKVRNPWGEGEFKSGMWDDDGPGWKKHPEVKAACKPVKADDGVFWVDVDEFFKYFTEIYLCAHDMSKFVE